MGIFGLWYLKNIIAFIRGKIALTGLPQIGTIYRRFHIFFGAGLHITVFFYNYENKNGKTKVGISVLTQRPGESIETTEVEVYVKGNLGYLTKESLASVVSDTFYD